MTAVRLPVWSTEGLVRTEPSRETTNWPPIPVPLAISNFDYIADLRDRFRRRRMPIISVDTKKRELVGNFKDSGAHLGSLPQDWSMIRSDSIGVAIPFGIYDPVGTHGSVVVGISHDTPALTVHAISHWWQRTTIVRSSTSFPRHVHSNWLGRVGLSRIAATIPQVLSPPQSNSSIFAYTHTRPCYRSSEIVSFWTSAGVEQHHLRRRRNQPSIISDWPVLDFWGIMPEWAARSMRLELYSV